MKVLVLGGTRFVGLRLVRLLASEGHDITLLNRGKTEAQLPQGIKRLYADRRNPGAVKSVLEGKSFEVVFDFTGYQRVNLEPVVEILNNKVDHYVYQSTVGVYDLLSAEILPMLEDFPYITQVTGISGLAAYQQEKMECEKFLFKAHAERGFPVTMFRCSDIFGPENWMDDREGSYFARLLQGRKILIPGNGSSIIHPVYVDDLARAYLSVVGNRHTFGQAYNILQAEYCTLKGYIDTIAQIVGIPAEKVYLEPQVVRKLKGSIGSLPWERNYIWGIQKAKEHFGFWPKYGIKSAMENTYRWWLENRGLEKIQFIPGKLGHDVDLAYEEEVIRKWG